MKQPKLLTVSDLPRPWQAEQLGSQEYNQRILDAEDVPIVHVSGYSPDIARLWAAAPELLESVQELLSSLRNEARASDSLFEQWGEVQRARAAIARATGKEQP